MNKEKIKKLIEKMLIENQNIKSVVESNDDDSGSEEYYFTYPDDKYLWSTMKDGNGENYIFYYPSKNDKSTFLRFGPSELDYSSQKSLKLLFDNVRAKLFGFDTVLDDILGTNDF